MSNANGYGNTIVESGGNDIVNAGAGNATVQTGSGNLLVELMHVYSGESRPLVCAAMILVTMRDQFLRNGGNPP